MSSFSIYFAIGYEHILNPEAYDHIMFILALCAAYELRQWRNVLILVTAFTVGHSLTLALATLDILPISRPIIEFLIPFTILATSLSNVLQPTRNISQRRIGLNYFMALFFGCIHGMAFSGELQMLLGKEENIVVELLAFNLGIELGQIVIVVSLFLIASILMTFFRVKHSAWNLFISGAAAGISVVLMMEKWPW